MGKIKEQLSEQLSRIEARSRKEGLPSLGGALGQSSRQMADFAGPPCILQLTTLGDERFLIMLGLLAVAIFALGALPSTAQLQVPTLPRSRRDAVALPHHGQVGRHQPLA